MNTTATTANSPNSPSSANTANDPTTVDPTNEDNRAHWIEVLGATAEQLEEAVQAVGGDPAKVREHLLHQGASAGAG